MTNKCHLFEKYIPQYSYQINRLKSCSIFYTQIHIYIYINIYSSIHNRPLLFFSQDYGLTSHTTHLACINFIREWWDLQINVDSERQIFEKLFFGRFYLPSKFLSEICWDKIAEEIFFFYFSFRCLTWAIRLIGQHTTY